jgi:site-specific recombinase XerC
LFPGRLRGMSEGTVAARRAVQELMGHADPATTAGYAAYDQAQGAAAVEAIPVPDAQIEDAG